MVNPRWILYTLPSRLSPQDAATLAAEAAGCAAAEAAAQAGASKARVQKAAAAAAQRAAAAMQLTPVMATRYEVGSLSWKDPLIPSGNLT